MKIRQNRVHTQSVSSVPTKKNTGVIVRPSSLKQMKAVSKSCCGKSNYKR
jgi:hypothetical protein